jgi:hypothetical protein
MVGDEVDDGANAIVTRGRDESFGLPEVAEARVDVAIVDDVVATVGHRRRVPGREPDGIHSEVAQVRKSRLYAGQVAGAVAVAVGKAAWVDLVDRRAAPPGRRVGSAPDGTQLLCNVGHHSARPPRPSINFAGQDTTHTEQIDGRILQNYFKILSAMVLLPNRANDRKRLA